MRDRREGIKGKRAGFHWTALINLDASQLLGNCSKQLVGEVRRESCGPGIVLPLSFRLSGKDLLISFVLDRELSKSQRDLEG